MMNSQLCRSALTISRGIHSKGAASILQRSLHASSSLSDRNPTKHEWLVWLPDHEGALQRRLQHRPRHLSELSNYPSDFLLWGGPYLRKPVVSSSSTNSIQEPLDMSGSVLLAWANSPEEVKDVLQKDIFTKEKVWNWEEIRILPFKSTVRKAM
ncbi:uncharacterized protein SEPMUDRAFT_109109 [Sphaerulina musiva SO2202]|uniref:YCII-related domain-containing protein n=1 Tax=Sphaerulina musiva (strain SO2202) TaxID=692275 RepID=N1QG96_SPHMS|nr:uncharacterized protein SEPMUDRAFT_109109 [Sphaerulina musiva SO2202]EMF12353.1 hypothetical protein SEPMUDRAFT_109109 [Sphaerulina musiva SO2202]